MEASLVVENGIKKFLPYLICAYNGKEYFNSFINKPISGTPYTPESVSMIFSLFIKRLILWGEKSSSIDVFAHNFAGFDGIFRNFVDDLYKMRLQYAKTDQIPFMGRPSKIPIWALASVVLCKLSAYDALLG